MKKVLLLSGLFLFVIQLHLNANLRIIKHQAFQRGEKLNYRIHYGFINAGVATLEITDHVKKFSDRNTYHVVGVGRSVGSFDFFFKIRDRYETYIDEEAILPWYFVRRVDEGGFKINQDYAFDHQQNVVKANGKTITIWQHTQDMLSAFYYARRWICRLLIWDKYSPFLP
jgi:hypothetical protein